MVIDYTRAHEKLFHTRSYFLSEAEMEIRSRFASIKWELLQVVKWPSAMIDVSARRPHIAWRIIRFSIVSKRFIRESFWIRKDNGQLYFRVPIFIAIITNRDKVSRQIYAYFICLLSYNHLFPNYINIPLISKCKSFIKFIYYLTLITLHELFHVEQVLILQTFGNTIAIKINLYLHWDATPLRISTDRFVHFYSSYSMHFAKIPSHIRI